MSRLTTGSGGQPERSMAVLQAVEQACARSATGSAPALAVAHYLPRAVRPASVRTELRALRRRGLVESSSDAPEAPLLWTVTPLGAKVLGGRG